MFKKSTTGRAVTGYALAALMAVAGIACFLTSCGAGGKPPAPDPAALQALARELTARLPVVDTHIDFPEVAKPYEDIVQGTSGNFDYPRARLGGLNLAFLAAFVPPEDETAGTAFAKAEERIDLVRNAAAAHPAELALVLSPEEAFAAFEAGRLGLAVGMENAAPLEGRLDRLEYFRDRGISYIGLVHAEDNHVCDSSTDPDAKHLWGGLSPFGREVVLEMNRLGIMIDVSHVSDEAFRQILELSSAPVIASHAGLRSRTPGFERNLSDEMVKTIADSGGVVQLAFGSLFLKDEYRKTYSAADLATVREAADAIDRAVKIAGADHVGFGSDFDGVAYSLPKQLSDVSMYANLVRELLALGYGKEDLAKILGGNLLRVWAEVRAKASG